LEKELAKYYEERFSTMSTKGWQDFVEDTKEIYDVYNNLFNVSSAEDLYFKKGQLDILNWILTLKEVSTKTYEDLQREEDI